MLLRSLFDFMKRGALRPPVQQLRQGTSRRPPCRLSVESLDERIVPASLSIGDAAIVEANEGIQYAEVSVKLDVPSNHTVSVNYATAEGMARSGSDYGAASGRVTFAPGESSKTIAVPVYGDRLAELNETFVVNLSGARRAKIADGQGVVTIRDDEPRINIAGTGMAEGNSGTTLFTFTVSLSAAYDEDVTVYFATADGSGFFPTPDGWATTADNDYVATSGTLTFAPDETTKTITVEVVGDVTPEPNEWFYVNLSGASGNALIATAQATGMIYDDDTDSGGGGGGGGDDCTPDSPYYPNC